MVRFGFLTLISPFVSVLAALAGPFTTQQMEATVASKITQVEEFRDIREFCSSRKMRVWIFGGTAATFGHYVRWDLERQAGDKTYEQNRFDFHYSNIFRSNQDLDLVTDGSKEDQEALIEFLKRKFPYVQGSKDKWEVRLLKETQGDKEALLGNPDFLNQHTDSNSTGMIEITKAPAHEAVARDLRHWDSHDSDFLKDLAQGTIHYYFSDLHDTTSRVKAGNNPEILSVIRLLIKIAQFDLELNDRDRKLAIAAIQRFKPDAKEYSSYVRGWIEKNGKKLFQNAVDIEKTWNLIDELGLRKKLIEFSGKEKEEMSLAWWLSKEPLRSYPLGQGPGKERAGKTAEELGLDILAHGTSDFPAFESITMSKQGVPNVFISRQNSTGEAAAYGNGFYTRRGKTGAGHSHFTIRFKIDPHAVEGKDFFLAHGGDFVVILNRNAITVLPETLNVSIVDWFKMIESGKTFLQSDEGIIQKIRSRVQKEAAHLTDEEDLEISQIMQKALDDPNKAKDYSLLFKEFINLGLELKHLKLSFQNKMALALMSAGNGLQSGFQKAILQAIEDDSFKNAPADQKWKVFSQSIDKAARAFDSVGKSLESCGYAVWFSLPEAIEYTPPSEWVRVAAQGGVVTDWQDKCDSGALWDKGFAALLKKKDSPRLRHEVRVAVGQYFPNDLDNFYAFTSRLNHFPEVFDTALSLSSWAKVLAENTYRDADTYQYMLEPVVEILQRVFTKADLKEQKKWGKTLAQAVKAHPKTMNYLFYIWGAMPASTVASADFLNMSFTKTSLEMFFKAEPNSELLGQVLEHIPDKKSLEMLLEYWSVYANEASLALALSANAPRVMKLAVKYKANIKSQIGGVFHSMRVTTPHELEGFFDEYIRVAIEQKDPGMLQSAAYMFWYPEAHFAQWWKKLDLIVDALLKEPKLRSVLLKIPRDIRELSFIESAFVKKDGRPFVPVFQKVMNHALQNNDTELLREAISEWSKNDAFCDLGYGRAILQKSIELGDNSLVYRLGEIGQDYLDDATFEALFDFAKKKRAKGLIGNLLSSIHFHYVNSLHRNISKGSAVKRWYKAVTWTVPRQMADAWRYLQSCYSVGDCEPQGAVTYLLSLAFRHQDFEVLKEMIRDKLTDKSGDVMEYYLVDQLYFAHEVLRLLISEDPLLRELGKKLKEELKPRYKGDLEKSYTPEKSKLYLGYVFAKSPKAALKLIDEKHADVLADVETRLKRAQKIVGLDLRCQSKLVKQ